MSSTMMKWRHENATENLSAPRNARPGLPSANAHEVVCCLCGGGCEAIGNAEPLTSVARSKLQSEIGCGWP